MKYKMRLRNLKPGMFVVDNRGFTKGLITAKDAEYITMYDVADPYWGKVCIPIDNNSLKFRELDDVESAEVLKELLRGQRERFNDVKGYVEELVLVKTLLERMKK